MRGVKARYFLKGHNSVTFERKEVRLVSKYEDKEDATSLSAC